MSNVPVQKFKRNPSGNIVDIAHFDKEYNVYKICNVCKIHKVCNGVNDINIHNDLNVTTGYCIFKETIIHEDNAYDKMLFRLARGCKLDLGLNLIQSKGAVARWREICKLQGTDVPNLETAYSDFADVFVKVTRGLSIIPYLKDIYDQTTALLEAGEAVPGKYRESKRESLMYLFCRRLSQDHPERKFKCPIRKVTDIFQSNPKLIDGCLKDMQREQYVEVCIVGSAWKKGEEGKEGTAGKATIYRWIGE